MSIVYETGSGEAARKVLADAFNQGRLVSIVCRGVMVQFGKAPIQKVYLSGMVRAGNTLVLCSSITSIYVHRKINFLDRVILYLQRKV